MRELKFRVWDEELKTYNSPSVHHLVKQDGVMSVALNLDIVKLCETDRFVIQQFTGKYDINNNPIYEGDIVELVLAVQTDENGNKIGPEDQFGVYEVFYNERFAAYFLRVHRSNWFDTWFTTEKQAAKLTIDPMCPHLTCLERELGNFNITHVIGNIMENPELLKA